MHPAFSVIFFTTLAGAGQGLFTALLVGQIYELSEPMVQYGNNFYFIGGVIALVLLTAGLISSTFHLGHPLRGWRAFSQWRTSWLSREIIALPSFMLMVFIYTVAHFLRMDYTTTLAIGLVGMIFNIGLYICTGMIYACLKFLREWATPLTVINFVVFGTASGFSVAAVYASLEAPALIQPFAYIALIATVFGLITRGMVLSRNKELREKPTTTVQTAIGVRHPNIKQRSMGMMGGSYNTREFVHGAKESFVQNIKVVFMLTAFVIPAGLHLGGIITDITHLYAAALAIHMFGLVAERWHFFAQVNHPQNIYYQTVG
ncbi:MAG: dimethyl sulfoxide reductase anchor subunit [Gammaproteobacteria bacterium]|nr:dimethyl sulfoxide reductase anchor subunit [Gammaproteobacteria bacterium]